MSSSKSEDVQRWRAAVCEAVASMTPDPNGKFMRYQDHVERLAKVTAERDQLRNATHVASYERGIAEGRKQSEHNLAQLLDAVDELRRKDERACRYYTPENIVDKRDAIAKVCALAAKIREERS